MYYHKLVKIIAAHDFKFSKKICEKAIKLANQIEHTNYAGKFYVELGIYYARNGNFTDALKAYESAYSSFEKAGTIEPQIGTLHNIGEICELKIA